MFGTLGSISNLEILPNAVGIFPNACGNRLPSFDVSCSASDPDSADRIRTLESISKLGILPNIVGIFQLRPVRIASER
jgi:hypothetical protein